MDDIMYFDFTFPTVAFPVKFGLDVTPFKKMNVGAAKNLKLGYTFGFYVCPDSFGLITGLYHGPQIGIAF
jgi:hypothetical protein